MCGCCFARTFRLCCGRQQACIDAALSSSDSAVTGIISPRDARLHDWLSAVGGTLEFDYRPRRLVANDLPGYVPVVGRWARGTQLPVWRAYAVHLHTVLTPRRLHLTSYGRDLRSYFCAPARTKMVLLCYARDTLMEEIWARRRTDRVIQTLSKAGFDLIVAPNFSVYLDQPRMTHLIRMRMSHIYYRDMMEAGLSVIPHIYFGARRDVERWAEWIAANPCVQAVACNLQTVTDSRFFRDMLEGLALLRGQVGPEVRLVVSGPSSPTRLRDVFARTGPNTIITNAVPHQVAMGRHVLSAGGGRSFRCGAYEKLLDESIEVMATDVEDAKALACAPSRTAGSRRVRTQPAPLTESRRGGGRLLLRVGGPRRALFLLARTIGAMASHRSALSSGDSISDSFRNPQSTRARPSRTTASAPDWPGPSRRPAEEINSSARSP